MGTANFFKDEVENYYVFGMTQYDENDEPIIDDFFYEMERDDVISNVTDELRGRYNFTENDKTRNNSVYFGDISETVCIEDNEGEEYDVEIVFRLKYNIGYYEGACLDFDFSYYSDYEYDDIDDLLDDLLYEQDGNIKIDRNKAYELIDEKRIEIWEYIEKIYGEYTMKLEKTAQFSNGEAIYKEINK